MVMTSYQGASASDIENNVSRPLENVLNTVSNLKHITSKSRENISIITLEFEYGKNIDELTNDVRDKLDLVKSSLPDGAENPTIFKFSTDMIPILVLSAKAKESMPALYKILDNGVANPLARIGGVGTVSVSGAPKREIHVYIDPVRLEAYHLSVESISSIIAAENKNVPMPTQDNARVGVVLEMPIGTRTEVSRDIALQVERLWKSKYPEIEAINFTVGQASSDNAWASMSDNGTYIITYNIRLSNPADRKRGIVEICDSMRKDLENFPELKKYMVNVGGNRSSMMGSGQATLDLEVYGYDFGETDKVAKELRERMSKVHGCVDVTISRGDYQPEYQIKFDREKLALNGLNLSTAANYARNRINGAIASKYREEGDEYDIKVMYAPEYRQSIESIENILVYNSQGKGIRIKDLGTVVEESEPPTIERKDRERVNTVQAVISGASMDKVVAAARQQISQINVPSGVTVQVSGTYEDQQESFADLMTLGGLIIILVFIVMAAQFESLTYPFIIMFALPFGFSGVLIALWISGSTLNLMSAIGMIMLIGIVVKNGIVLVDYINLNRERGLGIINSVVKGGKSRLRPVIMTSLTAILGMIPMAIGGGQGSEMWKPMGIAVIGGLTISTVLTLVIVPVLYCVFAGTGVKRNRKKMRELEVVVSATEKD